MTTPTSFLYALFFLISLHGCVAQVGFGGQSPWQSSRGFGFGPFGQRACRFENLAAIEPSRRIQHEAGVTEYYDQNNEHLRCAGLSVRRRTIEPRGLRLPAYSNTPSLVYITQGRCMVGVVYPGCPESYQSFRPQSEQFQQGEAQSRRPRDEHQKVHRVREGDIVALPTGVTHWFYNDGDVPAVAITVSDTTNSANQLEPRRREFLLAGRHQSEGQSAESEQQSGNNILSGFDTQLLAEALGVNQELARRLQSQNDQRGEIVRVQQGLQMLRPSRFQEQQQQEQEYQGERYEGEMEESRGNYTNGLDENFCTMKIRANINDPSKADVYNPRSGRITILNNQKLPILNNIQMSANRVVLRRHAVLAPHWNINAHSLMYVTGGRGRVQIVNNQGKIVFDGQLRQKQVLLVPQNYAVLKRAYQQDFEYVSFKTNPNAMVSKIIGKTSTIQAMPLDVIRASYRLSIEQARRLKNSRREEMSLFALGPERASEEQREEYDPQFERDINVPLGNIVVN